MNALIKSAVIIDPKSEFNNSKQDLLIEKGRITKIGGRITNPKKYPEIRFNKLHVSPGWFDSSVCFGEPGYEERETIANGLKVASRSGFTSVALNTNTNPIPVTGADIAFIKAQANGKATTLYPLGALSLNAEGEALAELFDMSKAGAIAFHDYQLPLENANFMKLALQYCKSFDGLVCGFPLDENIALNGVMHEQQTSTALGLKGIPSIAESLRVSRDLELLKYTEGKLHIPTISTSASVELIRAAKKDKLDVSCSVAIHNLFFTDEALQDFNTDFKVLPPLRSESDVHALKEGLRDGTIDMVTSDHNPLDIELKKLEFDHASFGTIGLESAFGALLSLFPLKTAVRFLTRGKSRFNIPEHHINIGEPAELSLFSPEGKKEFHAATSQSTSKNAIFDGVELKGEVFGIISNNKIELAKK